MITGETIWITGASSGIGFDMTRQLLEAGNHVIASARNLTALNSLKKSYQNLKLLAVDVTDHSNQADLTAQLSKLSNGKIDRVILNAGDCRYLEPEHLQAVEPVSMDPGYAVNDTSGWISDTRYMLEVNFIGQLYCFQLCKTLLLNSQKSHLCLISSQVIHAPFSQSEAYGASKAAAQYFFDSLRLDVHCQNIDITTIQPGFVDTPLTQKNKFEMPFLQSSEVAAKRIITAIEKRVYRFIFPRRLFAFLLIVRWFPRMWLKKTAPVRVVVPASLSSTSES